MFEHIDYDPSSSTFFRFNRDVGCKIKKGSEAGSKKSDSRIEITVKKKSYNGNRVAWELIYGSPPPPDKVVVPLDGNSLNLAIDNLKLMTWAQQRIYVSMTKNLEGGCLRPNKDGTFRVYYITRIGGVSSVEALGTYPTREEALEVYRRKLMTIFMKE